MKKDFTCVGSVYLLLIKDNKILLGRRFKTGFMDGFYGVPAGHIENAETAKEGCARETKEEIGIDIKPEDLEVVHVMYRDNKKDVRVDFFMTTKSYKGEIKNCEPHKCDGLDWFDLDNLPDNTIDFMKAGIENYRNNITYSEFGW
ncbi:MAG: NUDIX domain-containing protein [Candidatus Nomurabacteria bacterium]|nr:MAG: NUDIX domain-containing protein [Candidatus Nomurabacteria bacterium]